MTQKKPYLTNILKLQTPLTRVQRFNDNVVFIMDKSFILCSPFALNRELGGIFHVNYQHTKHIIAVCPVYVRNSYLASLFYGDGSYITQSNKTPVKKKLNTSILQPKITINEKKPPAPLQQFYNIQKVTSVVKQKVFIDSKNPQKLKSSSSISKLLINDDDSPNLNKINLKPVKTEPKSLLNNNNIDHLSAQKTPIIHTYVNKAHSSSSFSNQRKSSLLNILNNSDQIDQPNKKIDFKNSNNNDNENKTKNDDDDKSIKQNKPNLFNTNANGNQKQNGNKNCNRYVEPQIIKKVSKFKIKNEEIDNHCTDSCESLNATEDSHNLNENEESEEFIIDEYLDKNNSENIWLYVDSENYISAFSLTCKCNLTSFKFPHIDNIIDICGINNPKCINGQFAILTESNVLICEIPCQKVKEKQKNNDEDDEDDMTKYIIFEYQKKVLNISPFLDGLLMMRDHAIEYYNYSKISTFYENEQLSNFYVTDRIERKSEKRYQNLLLNQNDYLMENDKIIILEESDDSFILSEINSSKKLGIKACKLVGICDDWVASFCLGKFLVISNINNKEQSIKIALNLSNERTRNLKEIIVGYNSLNDSLTVILVFTTEIAFYTVKISIITGENIDSEEDEYEDEEEEEAV